jgi:LytS/YehU family sensor histidine kinase/ligand-binding sensor domain-containing protein
MLLYQCLLMIAGPLSGQPADYHVQVMTAKKGLVDPNQADEIIIDRRGFLWVLTTTKVQRFDGKNILSFSFDDRCTGIQEDDEGTIWMASRQNIYRYTNDYAGFEKLPAGNTAAPVYRSLLAGPGKKIYLLAANGIVRWNSRLNTMEPVGVAPFKSTGNFSFLKSYGDWLFFRLDNNTVVRYNTITAAQDSVFIPEANFLLPMNADTVWVRQSLGGTVLACFKTKKVTPLHRAQFSEAYSNKRIFITGGFAVSPGKFIVILDDRGYYTYNAGDNSFKKINLFYHGRPLTGKPLLSNSVFLKEDNGTVWLLNEDGYLFFKPSGSSFGLIRSNNDDGSRQWNNNVRNITEDSKGNIWFGTGNGFCKWNRHTGKVSTWSPKLDAADYLNYPSVKSIGISGNKIIIGQSEKGFWIFDPAKQIFTRPQFNNDSVKKAFQQEFNHNMLKLRNGNFLALSKNAWLIDKHTFSVKKLKMTDAPGSCRTAYEDAAGRIWMLGSNGILAADSNFNTLYQLPDKMIGKWCNAIVQTGDETFWVAAKNLYEIKLQPQKKITVKPIFPSLKDVHFSNLYKDSLGNIWMCHEEGIYRYVSGTGIVEQFDRNDNVQNFYGGVSNYFRGSNGTVYFGSLNGINYFTPEKIPFQNDSLQVQLLNITVNRDDSSWLLHRSLQHLNHSQNTLTFNFIAPNLYNAEKIQYRYKMEGGGNDWVNLGNNTSVSFNSMQAGKYAFYAAASLNGKYWYNMPTAYAFTIHPPFWKKWWFLLLVLATFITMATILVRRRIRLIKEREAEKTALQKMKAANYREQLEIEKVINYFAASMNSVNSVDEILWDVARNCISKLDFEDCVIYLKDEGRNTLVQKAAWGPKTTTENKIINPIEILPGKGIVGSVALSGKAEIIADTSADPRYIVDDIKRLSEIAVPVTNNGLVIGVIDSEHSQKDFYTDRHLQILVTIASLCAGKIIILQAEQQTRAKEIEVLRLHKDVATSQLTALRMQMNPHFIFNALNSVQHYILQGNVSEANKYLSKFSKLQREVLHCSSLQFITLEKEIGILHAYLQLEQFRFGETFVYQIHMTGEIEPEEIKIPPMMLQPFVENAIWHGLMPLHTEKNLDICFTLHSEDILLATIRDNGIGRLASARLKNSNGTGRTAHASKGMSMVQQRLQLLQQQYDKPFDAVITDLTDVHGTVSGTQVTLKIFIGDKKS